MSQPRRPIADTIDLLLGLLKWPVAIAAFILLPFAAIAFLKLVWRVVWEPLPILPFAGGLAGYLVLWWLIFRKPLAGSFLSTLEHESTHALFAWATLHRVSGLRATWSRGGSIVIHGKGNWLVAISPYFFPTICVVLLSIGAFAPMSWRMVLDPLTGAAFGYHVTSTMRETHAGQTDLKRTGFIFALLFLPWANIVAAGMIVAFGHAGGGGWWRFTSDLLW